MKKRLLFLGVIVLVSFTVILLRENVMLKSKINIGTGNIEKVQQKDMLSMMLETEAGSGNYELTTRDSWPTEGYIFNSALSKCENGGELSWDDENKRVLMSGNVSDKCYVYFDLDNKITLANYIISQYNGVQGNNNIYYHDNSLENGAGDNSYRYAGSSETTNNYVCFGSDATTCPEDSLYRIIGVFDGQVKLIKSNKASSDLLGTDGTYHSNNSYRWTNLKTCPSEIAYIQNNNVIKLANRDVFAAVPDPDSSNGCNKWGLSELNIVNLNLNFLNNLGEEWSSKIADHTWKVSGITLNEGTNKGIYDAEIVDATSSYGPTNGISKIGLLYVSDFYFASYSQNNWLSSMNISWLLTPDSSDTIRAYCFYASGSPYARSSYDNNYFVYPAFYLKESITYASGTGTSSDPIRIS